MREKSTSRSQFVKGGEWAARFIFITNRLCLDFTHTGGETGQRAVREQFHQPSDLADWIAVSPLDLHDIEVTSQEFESALRLREAVWNAAQAIRLGQQPGAGAIAAINAAAAKPDLSPQLINDSSGRVWHTPVTITAVLSTIARDAVDLFSGELRERIRECDNPKCSLLFVDTSRPGNRRWCVMERCGNPVKVARYRRRHS